MSSQYLSKSIIAAAVLMLAGWLSPASAGPVSAAMLAAKSAAPAYELVHGRCHRGVQRDSYHGWHFHTRSCAMVGVPPPGLNRGKHSWRYHGDPSCRYSCRKIGPVKTCQQVCRR